MKTILDVVAAWTALDVVLIAAWHLAHVHARRLRARIAPSTSATQRVFTLAPEALPREGHPTLVRAGRG